MSALTGLANPATGRIPTSAGPVAGVFRAMGFDAASKLVVGAGASPNFNGSVFATNAGIVLTDAVGAITQYVGGLPMTAAGALATEAAAPTQYDQGVGFTAAGRVAIE